MIFDIFIYVIYKNDFFIIKIFFFYFYMCCKFCLWLFFFVGEVYILFLEY